MANSVVCRDKKIRKSEKRREEKARKTKRKCGKGRQIKAILKPERILCRIGFGGL